MRLKFNLIITLVFILTMMVLSGCSSSGTAVTPDKKSDELANVPSIAENTAINEQRLFGKYDLFFNPETGVEIRESRQPAQHFNVTAMLPPPAVQLINYDPLTSIWTVNITITNPFSVNAYDLRLIVYTDDMGNRLMNPDGWINLFDIPGGAPVNPFIAFSKSTFHRKISAYSQTTENCQFYLPNPPAGVNIAIEASYPVNCGEPYSIYNFIQEEPFEEETGSRSDIEVYVSDWQDNVSEVRFYCPEITGTEFESLTHTDNNGWVKVLFNNTGAESGEYFAYITAVSVDSGSVMMYLPVTVYVNDTLDCIIKEDDYIDEATILTFDHLYYDCVSWNMVYTDYVDWYKFITPPGGLESATIDVTPYGNDNFDVIVFGAERGDTGCGVEIARGFHVELSNESYSQYAISVNAPPSGFATYELIVSDVEYKLANLDVDIYVATDDGTETGTWPLWEVPDPDEELTIDHINNMMEWGNNIWNKYNINLVWDGEVNIMSSEFYNLSDDTAMHDTYGASSGKLSMYFVNQCGGDKAYCHVIWPEWWHDVEKVFTVYPPSCWYMEEVVAHEHGHALGYYFDMYLYDQAGCACGDNDCYGETPFLFWDQGACYAGNLMWYSMGYPWSDYDLTTAQVEWLYYFNHHFNDNFPFY